MVLWENDNFLTSSLLHQREVVPSSYFTFLNFKKNIIINIFITIQYLKHFYLIPPLIFTFVLLVSQSPFQLGECLTFFSLVRRVSAGRDMCLTFFSLVRHVSHLFQFLAQTLSLPCAVESHPTPGDSHGSSSPSRSISGVSSHVADGGSARVPHECVQPSLSWSSSPRSIHSPEHHVIFHPSCSHHVHKGTFGTLDSSVHSGLMFSIIHMFVFLSIHDTLSTLLQHHKLLIYRYLIDNLKETVCETRKCRYVYETEQGKIW